MAPDGARRSAPVTFATRREAEAYLAQIQADLLRGQWRSPQLAQVSLAQYFPTWLRQRTELRPRTVDLYQRLAQRWILSPVGQGRSRVDLGPLALGTLSVPLVREWFATVSAEAAASATARATASATTATRGVHPARAWARGQGLSVPATGRLSPTLLAAWEQAGSPVPTPLAPSPRTDQPGRTQAAQAYRLLHAVLAQACQDGLLAANPAVIRNAGRVHHPERHPLTPAEVAALAEAVPAHYRAAVLLAAWSGLRPGELFALRRADIDTTAATVRVTRTMLERSGHPPTYGPPKSAAGARTVAVPAVVARALTQHLARYTAPSPGALVFTTTTGAPITSATRSKALRSPRRVIGRPDVTWHHLRHTGATLAAMSGATQAELQRRIGHSTTRAAALYQHASAERDQLIAQALDTLARTTTNVVPLHRTA